MNDLERAVAERMAAFRPETVPPFEHVAVRGARRLRARRAAVVVTTAATVAAFGAVLALLPNERVVGRVADPPTASPSAPPGFTGSYQEAPWVQLSKSAERTTVPVRVAGGRCSRYTEHDVTEADNALHLTVWNTVYTPTAEGVACRRELTAFTLQVTLPRPLRDGEQLQGGCLSHDEPRCAALRGIPGG
jgi:hypothetical protein